MNGEGDAFREWVADRIPGAATETLQISAFERPVVGQSNDTFLCSLMWSETGTRRELDVVVRIQSEDGLFLDGDVIREARVVRSLARSPIPVPEVLWQEPDPSVLGQPFYVMHRVAGTVPWGKPSIHRVGWLTTLRPDQRRRVSVAGIEAMAAVHGIDWTRAHRFLAAAPSPGLEHHLDWLVRWYRWVAADRSFPMTDAGLDAVLARAAHVEGGPPVLLWGDARPGNLMYADDMSLVAVLDWELASVGPAGIDLGYWLFMDAFHTSAQGVDPLEGWPDREETIGCYETAASRRVCDLDYFELLAAMFLAVTLIRQADRKMATGELEPSSRFAHDNLATQMLARYLALPIPELCDDFVRARTSQPPDPTSASEPTRTP